MKTLKLILIICLLSGCSVVNFIQEDTLYITRAYAGKFKSSAKEGKGLIVYTSRHKFYLFQDQPAIPNSVKCWVQLKRQSGVNNIEFYRSYLTWDGCDTLYILKQDFYTAEPIE